MHANIKGFSVETFLCAKEQGLKVTLDAWIVWWIMALRIFPESQITVHPKVQGNDLSFKAEATNEDANLMRLLTKATMSYWKPWMLHHLGQITVVPSAVASFHCYVIILCSVFTETLVLCFWVRVHKYRKPFLSLTCLLLSPVCPEQMDWSQLYPDVFTGDPSEKEIPRVEFADIGCGYGGLLGSYVSDLPMHIYFSFLLICIHVHVFFWSR